MIKMFSTLSEVRVVFSSLSQLNIPCRSAMKLHYTKNSYSLPFMCSFWNRKLPSE